MAKTQIWYGRRCERGLNLDLSVPIELSRRAVVLSTADDRGSAQNLLGSALWRLGEREAGTERLEEAVRLSGGAHGISPGADAVRLGDDAQQSGQRAIRTTSPTHRVGLCWLIRPISPRKTLQGPPSLPTKVAERQSRVPVLNVGQPPFDCSRHDSARLRAPPDVADTFAITFSNGTVLGPLPSTLRLHPSPGSTKRRRRDLSPWAPNAN
jgi:hypothetical protein